MEATVGSGSVVLVSPTCPGRTSPSTLSSFKMKFAAAAAAVAACPLAGAVRTQDYKTGNGTDKPLFQVFNFNAGATPHSAIG